MADKEQPSNISTYHWKTYLFIEENYLEDFCAHPSVDHIFYLAYTSVYGRVEADRYLDDTIFEKLGNE